MSISRNMEKDLDLVRTLEEQGKYEGLSYLIKIEKTKGKSDTQSQNCLLTESKDFVPLIGYMTHICSAERTNNAAGTSLMNIGASSVLYLCYRNHDYPQIADACAHRGEQLATIIIKVLKSGGTKGPKVVSTLEFGNCTVISTSNLGAVQLSGVAFVNSTQTTTTYKLDALVKEGTQLFSTFAHAEGGVSGQ